MAPPHAFLDVLANAQIRDAYLAGRISIILTQDLETILWTNGAGAHFMGLRTVAETIGVDSGFDRLTRHQIEAGLTAEKPVRVSGMPQSEFFLVNATHLAPLGDVVFLRSVKGQTDGQGGVDLIAGLSDETTAAAVFDLDGHAMRISTNFDENWFDHQELCLLLHQAHQEKRVKKQLLQKNPSQAVGVLALSYDPAVFLLITAMPIIAQETPTEWSKKFVFEPARLPLYFGWRVDANGCFEEVSPELEQVVGTQYADIVGKNFAQLASMWNIDGDGTLRALFKSHSSWGGIKVYWPVTNSQNRIEVTFFALPVYSRSREFIGFRGFSLMEEMRVEDQISQSQTSPNGLSPQEYETFSIIAHTLQANLREKEPQKEQSSLLLPSTKSGSFPENTPPSIKVKTPDLATNLAAFSPTWLRLTPPVAPIFNPFTSWGKNTPSSLLDELELTFLQKLPLGILIYRDKTLLFANEYLLRLTGFPTLESFHTHGVLALILREWLPKNILQHLGGEKLPIRITTSVVTWSDGGTASMISFLPDEQHQVNHLQQELNTMRHQAIELSNLLNIVSDGVLIIDAQGIIHSLNEGAARIFKKSSDSMRGQPFKIFFASDCHEGLEQAFIHMRQGGRGSSHEASFITMAQNGEQHQCLLQVSFFPLKMDEGYCLLLRDVSASHKLAQQKKQAQEQDAPRVEQKSSAIVARLSHQLRTPLTAILGLSQLMLAEKYGPLNNDRYRTYLRDIANSSDQIIRLLQHLDGTASTTSKRELFDIKKLDLTPLVNEILAKITPQANARRIIIRTSLAANLSPVLVDAKVCQQMLLKLLSNALHATTSGGQIILSVQNLAPEGVSFRLRDRGAGLSAAETKAIIQAKPNLEDVWAMWEMEEKNTLSQLHHAPPQASTVFTQVKKLAEANGARFHLRSEPGKGTLVEIVFALA